jgi:alpha-1,2-mannosyltransferase
MVGPKWSPVLMIFFTLYGPFLLQYGWRYRNIVHADLPSFYAASVSVFEHGESPYNPMRLGLSMEHDALVFHVFPYLYPPPSLLLFFPLSALTYADARHVVLLVNHLLFLVLVWAIPLLLLRTPPRHDLAESTLCIVYSLTFYPVVVTLNHGQVNILLLTFFVLFWLLARRGNAVLAALFLALAVLLKTYPLIIIPMLLLIRRWREGVYTVAWLGLATIVSFMVLPNVIWHDWLTNVLPSGGYIRIPIGLFSPADINNQSLNGFFARAFRETASNPASGNPEIARLLTYGMAGLTAAATGLAAWRSRTYVDSFDRTILVALPAMYLVAPFSWEHHMVYLLPSILMLLNSRSSFSPVRNAIFFSLCVATAVLIGMPTWLQFKFYGVLVLWGLCVFTACNRDIELPNKRMNGGME